MERSITIRQLQEIYLGMIAQYHDFCVRHNLTYYMVGGTLLGAAREKGFIPWDDDVDFAMPRPDYERFIREYSGEMVLWSIHGNRDHLFPYVKLFHRDTPICQVEDQHHNIRGKVFVKFDIYPIDGLGNDSEKAHALAKEVSRRKQLLYLNLSRDKSRNPVKNIVLALIRTIPSGGILRGIDRTMQRYAVENSTLWTRWREGTENSNIFDRSIFSNPVLLPFEQLQLYAPREYQLYLTQVYGDYMVENKENSSFRHDVNSSEKTEKYAQIIGSCRETG